MRKPKKQWHHKEILRGMYEDQKLTMRQIAQILGTTASTIKYWMRRFNIKSREHRLGDMIRGTFRSKEYKQSLSEFAKKRFSHPENHPMFGHRHSEESRRKMSETKKRKHRERQLAKM